MGHFSKSVLTFMHNRVSNPGRNVWDKPRGLEPPGRLLFQIPEGTFGTRRLAPRRLWRVGSFKSRKERLGLFLAISIPPYSRSFKSRKERLGQGLGTLALTTHFRFQIPEGTFGTRCDREGPGIIVEMFQIPEGTFGTCPPPWRHISRTRVSNPGRNVWDAPGRDLRGDSEVRFKSRKERLGRATASFAERKPTMCFKSRKERLGP